jgi:hypothetical protein
MYQNKPEVFLYTGAKDVVSTDFDSEQDIYIFDRGFTWTYIHTHEADFGPYFYTVQSVLKIEAEEKREPNE